MKVLVWGFGSIGKRHVGVLQSEWPAAEIHVISSRSEYKGVTYRAVEEVPDINDYDYYVIATPTALHYEHLMLVDSRVSRKTIFIEKPMFDDRKVVDSFANEIVVGYNLRFHSLVQQLKVLCQSRKINAISLYAGQYLPDWRPRQDYTKCYSANRNLGGGVIGDLSHEWDVLLWLAGALDCRSVVADKVSSLRIDVEDVAYASGVLKCGGVFSLSVDYLSRIPMRRYLVHLEGLTVEVDLVNNKLMACGEGGVECLFKAEANEMARTYCRMHKAILGGVGGDCCHYADGLRLHRVLQQVWAMSKGMTAGGV